MSELREPEWAGGKDAVHAWLEYRPAKGRNTGRLMGSIALCGARSVFMFDADWSAPLSWPNSMRDAARCCNQPICGECKDKVLERLAAVTE